MNLFKKFIIFSIVILLAMNSFAANSISGTEVPNTTSKIFNFFFEYSLKESSFVAVTTDDLSSKNTEINNYKNSNAFLDSTLPDPGFNNLNNDNYKLELNKQADGTYKNETPICLYCFYRGSNAIDVKLKGSPLLNTTNKEMKEAINYKINIEENMASPKLTITNIESTFVSFLKINAPTNTDNYIVFKYVPLYIKTEKVPVKTALKDKFEATITIQVVHQ